MAAVVLLLSSGCNKAQPETELFSLLLEKQEQEQRQEQEERQGENVILLTHSATAFSTTQKIAGRFKMALEEKSGGRFRWRYFRMIHWGTSTTVTGLFNQTVEMRIGPAATDTMGAMLWASTLSDASLEEIDKLLKDGEARRMLEEECEAKGIKLLAVFPAHYRVLTGNERIDEAEDFSKLEMRIFTSNTTEGPIGRVSERRPEFMIFIRCFPHCSRDSLITGKYAPAHCIQLDPPPAKIPDPDQPQDLF